MLSELGQTSRSAITSARTPPTSSLCSVLVSQPGPLVVSHGSAAILRPGRRRHGGGPGGGQVHPETKGGCLPKLLPFHVLQGPSAAPGGELLPRTDLCVTLPRAADWVKPTSDSLCVTPHTPTVPDQQCLEVVPGGLGSGLRSEGDPARVSVRNR